MIGDPKQSIYGFRGADIHAYLAARRATQGRHYTLGVNYRSTEAMVAACNRLFQRAEGWARGAFRFRSGDENPIPFLAVAAKGRADRLILNGQAATALTCWTLDEDDGPVSPDDYRQRMARRDRDPNRRLATPSARGKSRFQTRRRAAPAADRKTSRSWCAPARRSRRHARSAGRPPHPQRLSLGSGLGVPDPGGGSIYCTGYGPAPRPPTRVWRARPWAPTPWPCLWSRWRNSSVTNWPGKPGRTLSRLPADLAASGRACHATALDAGRGSAGAAARTWERRASPDQSVASGRMAATIGGCHPWGTGADSAPIGASGSVGR